MTDRRERRSEPSAEFALLLRTLREERHLSLRQLAMRAGVSGATIWKWEHGECNPRPRLISALVKALQVPVSSLIAPAGGDEPLAVIPGPEAQERPDPVLSQPELLADVIAQAKQMIAKAAGNSPDKILIRLDF